MSTIEMTTDIISTTKLWTEIIALLLICWDSRINYICTYMSFKYCSSNRLYLLPYISSILIDQCQCESSTSKSLYENQPPFEFGCVTSDKERWMWHCHVAGSLNVTKSPGSKTTGRKSMMQTPCGVWRAEMHRGQCRVMQAVKNQSVISFNRRVKWDLIVTLCEHLQSWAFSLWVFWFILMANS